MSVLLYWFVMFFFKQKTAYEMRISDWSSDVCSSDLDVERPRVRRAIRPDQPRAVDRKAHRQVLDRDIVDDLIIGALKEGRIDRRERAHPLRRQARRKGHRMLLGDPNVEAAIGVRLQIGRAHA